MAGIAISRLGISLKEYWKLTPRELFYALEDNKERTQNSEKVQFEAARLVCVSVWNASQRKLRTLIEDPVEFMPFSWEERKKQTVDDMLSVMMGIASSVNKKITKTPM